MTSNDPIIKRGATIEDLAQEIHNYFRIPLVVVQEGSNEKYTDMFDKLDLKGKVRFVEKVVDNQRWIFESSDGSTRYTLFSRHAYDILMPIKVGDIIMSQVDESLGNLVLIDEEPEDLVMNIEQSSSSDLDDPDDLFTSGWSGDSDSYNVDQHRPETVDVSIVKPDQDLVYTIRDDADGPSGYII